MVAVTDLHEDDSKQHLQGLDVAGAKMVPGQGRGIALNRALSYMSHNIDFATYSRTKAPTPRPYSLPCTETALGGRVSG